jgi:UDP-galactopyranose mutase
MNKQAVYIIGAGLSGATTARLFANNNYQVIVYEAENHVGGNCYDYLNEHQILVQKYGPHIFHTDKKHVYDFLKQFAKFNKYHIQVKANVKKQLVDLPINFQSIDLFFKEKANDIKKQILAV